MGRLTDEETLAPGGAAPSPRLGRCGCHTIVMDSRPVVFLSTCVGPTLNHSETHVSAPQPEFQGLSFQCQACVQLVIVKQEPHPHLLLRMHPPLIQIFCRESHEQQQSLHL